MPAGAHQACRHPRCLDYAVRGGYCTAHLREARGPVYPGCSPTAARFRRLRHSFLVRHPLCNACRVVPATVLDHIVPHRGIRRLFWDQTNWQTLCVRCHGVKTAREVWGA